MSKDSINNDQTVQPSTDAPAKKNKVFPIVLIALVVVGGTFGLTKYIHSQHHEETDDAQVEASVSPVIPRISGYVTEIRVKDNQKVKKGDTLVILDNRSELIQVAQTTAALEGTKSNLNVAEATTLASRSNIATFQANIATVDAQIEAAKIVLKRATQDYDRYANLIKDRSITLQQFEQAEAAKQTAERQLVVLTEQRNAATRQTSAAATQSTATERQSGVVKANIQQRMADLDNAKLNLSYTVITSPLDGNVSKVNVQVGQLLQAGQSLFSVVANDAPWVVANFKETQLAKLRPGQKVVVRIDAVPGHKYEAKIASISPATGARFALLPPDNASGNFVKTVQRISVKIEFTGGDNFVKSLRAGMNAFVDVHVD